MQTSITGWNDMIKKEARGLNDFNLGDVQSVASTFIVTEKGTFSKKYYYVPKYLVRGYDGHNLWFNVSETQADSEFRRETRPTSEEYYRYKTADTPADIETSVPMVSKP